MHLSPIMKKNHKLTLLITVYFLADTEARLSFGNCAQDFAAKKAFCDKTGLKSIPQDLMTDLEHLFMSDCDITTLHNDSFQRYPSLIQLILTDNDISSIESGTFLSLKRLEVLDLSWNFLLSRLDGALSNVILSTFKAENCDLDSVPSLQVKKCSRVSLMDNQINRVTVTCKSRDSWYQYINLEGNDIRTITSITFFINCSVTELNLFDNPVEVIEPSVIGSLKVRQLEVGGRHLPLEQIDNLFQGVKRSVISHLALVRVGLENNSCWFLFTSHR